MGILDETLRKLVVEDINRAFTVFFIGISLLSGYDPANNSTGNSDFRVRINESNGRIETLSAAIGKISDVATRSLSEEVKNHVLKSSVDGDEIGVLIDPKLGGYANNKTNVIPMNPSARKIWKREVTDVIYNEVLENNGTLIVLTYIPFFDGPDATRPNSFAVNAIAVNLTDIEVPEFHYVVKGLIPNPTKGTITEANSTMPFLYSTGNVTVRGQGDCFYFSVNVGEKDVSEERVEMVTVMWDPLISSPLPKNMTGPGKCVKMEGPRKVGYQRVSGSQDVPGFLISQKLGGREDDPYNVMRMSPRAVKELETKMEEPVLSFLNSAKGDVKLWLNIMVIYPDSTTTRPEGFIIRCSTVKQQPLFTGFYIQND